MLYKNKKDWILKFVVQKKVLDMGCVNHELTNTKKSDWLHGIIHQHAASVLGVDYLEKEVCALQKEGYNIVCSDVETLELSDYYDVIVAGDLIEHLSNPGVLMEKAKQFLKPGGVLLVSTPNPIGFLRIFAFVVKGRMGASREHTCWFTDQVLDQLARRYGLKVVSIDYVDDGYSYRRSRRRWWPLFLPFFALNYVMCRLRPQFCETQCFVLKKAQSPNMK